MTNFKSLVNFFNFFIQSFLLRYYLKKGGKQPYRTLDKRDIEKILAFSCNFLNKSNFSWLLA